MLTRDVCDVFCGVVEHSLLGLTELLPEEVCRSVWCGYRVSSWSLSPSHQIQHFVHWFAAALGLDHAHSTKSQGSAEGCEVSAQMLRQIPALKLLRPRVACGSLDEDVAMTTTCLRGYRKNVALALHLVYEVSVGGVSVGGVRVPCMVIIGWLCRN